MSEMDSGFSTHTTPMQRPGGRHGGGPGGRRRGGRGHTEHATLDLQGARQGLVDAAAGAETHDGSAVYSTGSGTIDSYHYHRGGDQASQLYAQREDMQVPNRERQPDVKGPGQ